MTAVKEYLNNIKSTITTIFDGMSITFSYLFQKPITIEYPNRIKIPIQKQLPDRYRGFLQVDHRMCVCCELCVKACPINVIALDGVKVPGRKGKAPYYFYIDMSKCMFCGLCVEACPSSSIYFTTEFEGSVVDQKNLIFSYVPEEIAKTYLEQAAEPAKGNGKTTDPSGEKGKE